MEALILNFLLSFRFLVLWFRSEKGFGLDWARNERKVEYDYYVQYIPSMYLQYVIWS
jgi:hypothetical protein